jgi:hypothetical protein
MHEWTGPNPLGVGGGLDGSKRAADMRMVVPSSTDFVQGRLSKLRVAMMDVCVGQLILSMIGLDELHASRMQCMIALTRFGLHVQALPALEGVFKGRWSDRGDAHVAATAGTHNTLKYRYIFCNCECEVLSTGHISYPPDRVCVSLHAAVDKPLKPPSTMKGLW